MEQFQKKTCLKNTRTSRAHMNMHEKNTVHWMSNTKSWKNNFNQEIMVMVTVTKQSEISEDNLMKLYLWLKKAKRKLSSMLALLELKINLLSDFSMNKLPELKVKKNFLRQSWTEWGTFMNQRFNKRMLCLKKQQTSWQ